MKSFCIWPALAVFVAVVCLETPLCAAPGQSFDEAKKHWAYQPIQRPSLPAVQNEKLVASPVDAFLLARLEEKNLTFAPPADKRTLLRRIYYDLIGLPPSYEEIRAFERDDSPDAVAKVVEKLLASPRYGERWGRHWLDYARYADTKDNVLSYGKDALRPYAYTYRDYVIRAFNEDLPFNQFIEDQLAADLLQPQVPSWRLAALGFLTLGRIFDNNPHDQIDDQIDTMTRGFLGLTVACARCHDHKYDAVIQKDYYALYGVFASSERPYDLPLIEDPEKVTGGVEFERELAKARKELEDFIDAEFAKLTEIFRQRIGDYLVRAATTPPDLNETAQYALSLIPEDFRPTLMQRTRRFLERRAKPKDRVFGLWAELMSLPEDSLPSAATKKIAGLRKQTDSEKFNPLVLEVFSKAAITNRAEIARVYGRLLVDVYEESKKPLAGSPGLTAVHRELLEIVTGEDGPLWFPRRDTPDHMSRAEKDRYNGLVGKLDKLAAHATNAPPARAMVLRDLPTPYEPHIFKRGNPSQPGERVPRAFLQVLSAGDPVPFRKGSGRLELAREIASPKNPLTARVWVNRVWMEHFGEPLVSSPSDFGARSEPPTHPKLLDWLASEFIQSGWSTKHLHRVMLLSRAYQQASGVAVASGKVRASADFFSKAEQVDPMNTLLWRYPRRRLDLEAMRDSMLFVSGRLDLTMGGRPVDVTGDPLNCRRTVYGLVDRQNLPALFRAFDFAVPDQCIERRPYTTVPQQALFALNSPFVMEQARSLMALSEISGAKNPSQTVERLFQRVLGRNPTRAETSSALRFIRSASADEPSEAGLQPWQQLAQVLLVSNEALFLD